MLVAEQVDEMPRIQQVLVAVAQTRMLGGCSFIDDDPQPTVVDLDQGRSVSEACWHRVPICLEDDFTEFIDVRWTHDARSRHKYYRPNFGSHCNSVNIRIPAWGICMRLRAGITRLC